MKTLTVLELLRRTQSLSCEHLAKKLGVTTSSITQIEGRHRRSWPRIRGFIARELCVSESELFDLEGFARTFSSTEIAKKNKELIINDLE